MNDLVIFSPSGVVADPVPLRRAVARLKAHGFAVRLDAGARARHQRFAGADEARVAAVHRVADAAPSVAMATRGGYGLTRLLDQIDWHRVGRSVAAGTRWVGHSDFTAFQMGLLAHVQDAAQAHTWAGPMACYDFGRADVSPDEPGVDDVTEACFLEAMSGALEGAGFRTEAGFDGLAARGRLWGGNLCVIASLLGTRHWPAARLIKGGVLYLEDVNEHPYRVERSLLQLAQAGVLDSQSAVLLGQFTEFKPSPLDRGYGLKAMVARVRASTSTPVLTGLPFGHVPTKLSLPFGRKVDLAVQGRDVLIGW